MNHALRLLVSYTVLMAGVLLPLSLQAQVTLNVLEWTDYITPHVAEFEKFAAGQGKNIKVNILKPDITNPEQIFEQVRKGRADVVTPTNNYYKMNDSQLLKVLAPLDLTRLSHYNSLYSSLREATYDVLDGKKHAVPLLGGSYGLFYNAAAGVASPDSWNALWKPEFKGKFSVTNDQFEANLYIILLSLGYPSNSLYDIDQIKFDREKVQARANALVANAHSFWGGEEAPTPELALTTGYWLGVAKASAAGQSWKLAEPKEGQTVWLDTMAIAGHLTRDPAKLEAAYLLLDYMISPAAQAKIAQMFGSVIVNPKAAGLLTADQVKASRVGDEKFFRDDYLWQPLTARTRNTYKAIWMTAMEGRK